MVKLLSEPSWAFLASGPHTIYTIIGWECVNCSLFLALAMEQNWSLHKIWSDPCRSYSLSKNGLPRMQQESVHESTLIRQVPSRRMA